MNDLMKSKTRDLYEEAAQKGLEAIIDYLEHRGTSPNQQERRLKDAKIGAIPAAAFARMLAAENNRMSVELMAQRIVGGGSTEAAASRKKLAADK